MLKRPQKITFAEMHYSGVRCLLIYCSDYHCSHWTAISGDRWPDGVRLSDIEPRLTSQACGRRGADVRPNFDWLPGAPFPVTRRHKRNRNARKPTASSK
jgi:hypothetical protein